MKLRWLTFATLVAVLSSPFLLPAAEKHLEFVEGLRDRQYYDYALFYLEQMETRNDIAKDIKDVIPFQKAITLLQGVRTVKSPEAQGKQLDTAKLFLEQFLKASPQHAKAAQANNELAQVLIGKGRVEVLQSKSPNNVALKADFQKKARDYFGQARKVFQAANDQYKAAYEKYGKFIEKTKEKQEYEARDLAMVNYIQAQLNLAIVTYEEAQTHEKTAPEYRQLLTKASTEFADIHDRYRQQVAGLYARMWEGKCFEEQGDLTKALGIYNELLGHGHDNGQKPSGPLKRLQDRVLRFRLICNNHDQRKDYQLVIQDASAWLKENPGNLRQSDFGLGIQWEMTLAQEMLAKKEGTPPAERDRLLNQALASARNINRFPGEFKEVSTAAIQRIMIGLNKDPGDPKDFDTAFGLARDMVQQIPKRTAAIEGSKDSKEKEKLAADLQLHLKETARILNLSLTLFTRKDEIKDINRARYFLSWVYYLLKNRSYESAILSEFVATRYPDLEPEAALDAAYLAMAAYIQAFIAAKEDERDFDIGRIIDTCNFITAKWPTTDKANEARMNLGMLYSQTKQPAEAAKWFQQVPESAPQYLDAQLKAGQAYWQAYIDSSILAEDKRPPKEKLDESIKLAQQILRDGIAKKEAKLPEGAPPVDSITAAKYSLVQIQNGSGAYKDALVYLAEGPRSLVAAVAVAEKEIRPKKGTVKSAEFASAVYRELLRTHVGMQQLDKARAALKELEKIAGAGGGAGITQILLDLGKELEKEVKRLQAAREPRLAEVLKSFENFLDDIFKRTDGQDFNSLSWVAGTYNALGEGMEQGDKAKSEGYFAKAAAAYQAILDKTAKDAKFAPDGALSGVRLRLVTCKRRQKAFAEAHQIVTQILKERPKALDAQVEAAHIYQDWAASGGTDGWEKWNLAIVGDQPPKGKEAEKTVWGWYDLGERLSLSLMGTNPNPDYEKQYLDARYNLAYCRFNYAMAQTKTPKKHALLEAARSDVTVTAMLSEDLGGGESWERFNKLFRDIQQKMLDEGHPAMKDKQIADLEKRIKIDPAEVERIKREKRLAEAAKNRKPKVVKAAAPAKPAAGGGMMAIVIVVIVVAGIGGVAAFFLKGRGKKKPSLELAGSIAAPNPFPAAPAPVKKKPAATKTKS